MKLHEIHDVLNAASRAVRLDNAKEELLMLLKCHCRDLNALGVETQATWAFIKRIDGDAAKERSE